MKWESSLDLLRLGTQAGGLTLNMDEYGNVGIGEPPTIGGLLSVAQSNPGSITGAYIKNTGGTAVATISRLNVGDVITATNSGLQMQYNHFTQNVSIRNLCPTTGTLDLKTTGGGIDIANNGNVGIGVANPSGKLDIALPSGYVTWSAGLNIINGTGSNRAHFIEDDNILRIQNEGNGGIQFNTAGAGYAVTISNNGIVSIGTDDPDPTAKLHVEGTVRADKFKVGEWYIETPDFVFNKDYNLRPIKEVEEFIKKNKHLPDVPSAKQMKKEGVDLAEMNMTLLKKVEELHLYVIQQQKEIESLRKNVDELKK